MTTGDFERLAATLLAEPEMSAVLGRSPLLLFVDLAGERCLWASVPDASLLGAFCFRDGSLRTDRVGGDRLRLLAPVAPRRGLRLERLSPGPGSGGGTVTLACRRVFAGTDEVLFVAVIGPGVEARSTDAGRSEPATLLVEGGPAARQQSSTDRVRRFIWSADPDGVFQSVSRPLAEVVGPEGADIVGRRWSDLGGLVDDPSGLVAAGFREGRSWAGVEVGWGAPGRPGPVPILLHGMPVLDGTGRLHGFRGFGLCRPGAGAPLPEPDLPDRAADQITTRPEGQGEAPSGLEAEGEIRPTDPPGADGNADNPGADRSTARPEHDVDATADTATARTREENDGHQGPLSFGVLSAEIHASLGAVPAPFRIEEGDGDWAGPEPAGAVQATAPGDPADAALRDVPGKPAGLSFAERGALQEIARALGARLEGEGTDEVPEPAPSASAEIVPLPPRHRPFEAEKLLERLPVGLTVLRDDVPLFANRFLLDLAGYPDLAAFVAAGGVPSLFRHDGEELDLPQTAATATAIRSASGARVPVDARLSRIDWTDGPAALLLLSRRDEAGPAPAAAEPAPASGTADRSDLASALDLAGIGVATLDPDGGLIDLNAAAERLFGYAADEVRGEVFTALFAPESHAELDALVRSLRGAAEGSRTPEIPVLAWPRNGEPRTLAIRAGRSGGAPRVLLVLRPADEAPPARGAQATEADDTVRQQTEFLARISHEIRTPVNAIIGFAEIMLEERFGPVGNERYRGYLGDIRDSGAHVVSLVTDLLDLAKATVGREDLSFTSLDLRTAIGQAVSLLQPAAARERIIVRTSFAPNLPPVVADERSIRQIAINLMSNAIKFTPAGGQVIVSAALNDGGGLAFRVRDTGIGMSEGEVQAALQPFRQLSTDRRDEGTGLGLPLAKALAEANGGTFEVTSRLREGTLVEVVFPASRVLAG